MKEVNLYRPGQGLYSKDELLAFHLLVLVLTAMKLQTWLLAG